MSHLPASSSDPASSETSACPEVEPIAPAPSPSAQGRTWSAGTLVYGTTGLIALFFWLLLGDFTWQMKERAVWPLSQLMLKQLEASDFLVGILLGSLPSALGLIIGPIISVRSDRHRGRWGRRIPYLLIPTPIIVLGMAGLAFTPDLGAMLDHALGSFSPGAGLCRIYVFVAFWSIFEIFTIVASAVFGGLINDVVPKPLIGRFFGLFRAVSLIAGIIFNSSLIGYAETHFRIMFLGIGALYGLGLLLMCLKVKERGYPPPDSGPTPGVIGQVKGYVRECFTHPFYLRLFIALMLSGLAGGPVNSFSIFYAKSLGMDMAEYGRLLVITYSISFVLAYGIGWLADRHHPLRMGIVTIGLYGIAMIWGGLVATDAKNFSLFFILHGVLMGANMTGTASLGQRLFPEAKFAQFASASGLIGALGYVILPPVTGALLDANNHAYRHTFTAGGVISLLSVAALWLVYRDYQKLGGDRAYKAPGGD